MDLAREARDERMGIGSVIGGTVGKLAVTAFDAIIHALFAPVARFINTQLLGWLVAVPDYAPPGNNQGGRIADIDKSAAARNSGEAEIVSTFDEQVRAEFSGDQVALGFSRTMATPCPEPTHTPAAP